MVKPFLILLLSSLVSSCGAFLVNGDKAKSTEREIASITVGRLLNEENLSFAHEIDDKLLSLHSYYVLAQKNLLAFDEAIPENSLVGLYRGQPYLNLIALRTQIDEIETDLSDISGSAQEKQKEKRRILEERISSFAARSRIASSSMENLAHLLKIQIEVNERPISESLIGSEIEELEKMREFQIYEKNIEHLSHMLEIDIRSQAKKFSPSEQENGNVTGQEFPAKVWSLTFSNGPDAELSPLVLKNLKDRDLTATFFQIVKRTETDVATGRLLRDSGMEIAPQSYSHKELTKVGGITLEKEITRATETLQERLGIKTQFFRLPFGSGVKTPLVRETIAKNKLIHAFWNVDALDWLAQTPDRIIERTKKLMKKTGRDSGIIVFHDTHMRGVVASAFIMDHLKTEGRRACALGTIISEMNEGAKTVCGKN